MTLHQVTRSEKLVDLFHAAGHVIRRVDTSMTLEVLDRFQKMEMYSFQLV